MKEKQILQLENRIRKAYDNVTGIVVAQDGEMVYEQYFHGYTPHCPVHVCSVTKSIVSILFGVAMDQGCIKSVKQKVLEFFPDYQIKRGEHTIQTVTLEHLLTMTAPYKFHSPPYTKVFSSESWVKATLDLLGGKQPVGTFRYTGVIGPDILSGILVQATGRPLLSFAKECVFDPMGIRVERSIVLENREQHMAFMKSGHESGWVVDKAGIHTGGWGLTLTPRNMADIGCLYSHGGRWKGRQMVSSEWVRQCTTEHSRWPEAHLSYGYLWWTGIGDGYAAIGDSGNVIYINPKKRLVVAIAALFKPRAQSIMELILEDVEPMYPACP